MNRTGTINIHDTSVNVWEEHVHEKEMIRVLRGVEKFLTARGWIVLLNPRIEKHYKCLSRFHRSAKKGNLEAELSLSGRHLEVKLFQNVIFENKSGGVYDFQKIAKMRSVSNELWIRCLTEMTALARHLAGVGYELQEKRGQGSPPLNPLTVRNLAEERRGTPLEEFNASWSSHRFERDESGWPSIEGLSRCWHNHKDRDGKNVRQCETKYIRHRGRLARVQCCGGVNSMWQAVSHGETLAYAMHAREFFDCDRPDLEPRRVAKGSVLRQKAELEKAIKSGNSMKVAALTRVLGPKLTREVTGTAGQVHRFDMKANDEESWSVWLIDEDTRTLSIFGDYGSWSYTWGQPSERRPFGEQLLSFDSDYIWRKLEGAPKEEFNAEETRKTIRQSILEMRRGQSIDRDAAAELWDDLSSVDSAESWGSFLSQHDRYDWWESSSYDPVHDPGLTHLMKVTLPRFKEAVRLHLESLSGVAEAAE